METLEPFTKPLMNMYSIALKIYPLCSALWTAHRNFYLYLYIIPIIQGCFTNTGAIDWFKYLITIHGVSVRLVCLPKYIELGLDTWNFPSPSLHFQVFSYRGHGKQKHWFIRNIFSRNFVLKIFQYDPQIVILKRVNSLWPSDTIGA